MGVTSIGGTGQRHSQTPHKLCNVKISDSCLKVEYLTFFFLSNVHDKRAQQTSERNTFHALHHFHIQPLFSLQPNITVRSNEVRLLLALQALQDDKNLSLRKVAKIYDINYTTLFHQRADRPARRNIPANLCKLTDLEEKTIV